MKIYDCIVIGAGPAGISSALYLKKANIDVLLLEKDAPGGTLNKISMIDNYPGYTEEDGPTLAFKMYSQLENFNVKIKIEDVQKIRKEDELFSVNTNANLYKSKYLIIASGKTPRKLEIEESDKYIGKGISYCTLCDGSLYKNKNVAVVGGGNSAMQAALYLSNIANKIYIINRSDKLRADKSQIDKAKKLDNVKIYYNTKISKIIGDDSKINGVVLDNNEKVDIEGIFVCIGSDINSSYYQNLDIKQDNLGIITDDNMMTNINNLYAVGDSLSKDIYQVITASSEGVIAAYSIIKNINKD